MEDILVIGTLNSQFIWRPHCMVRLLMVFKTCNVTFCSWFHHQYDTFQSSASNYKMYIYNIYFWHSMFVLTFLLFDFSIWPLKYGVSVHCRKLSIIFNKRLIRRRHIEVMWDEVLRFHKSSLTLVFIGFSESASHLPNWTVLTILLFWDQTQKAQTRPLSLF